MNAVYMKNGFKSGNISPKAGTLLRQAVHKLVEQDAELLIGGCTEVSVGWEAGTTTVPFIDVLDLLAKKMVERCYSPLIKKSESLSNG
jgi:aspartate racemase